MFIRPAGQYEIGILCFEGIVRSGRNIFVTCLFRNFASIQILHAFGFQTGNNGIDKGYIDFLAYASLLPLDQRCQDAHAAVHAGHHIADSHTGTGRFRTGPSGDAHGAAHSLGDEVIAGPGRIGTVLAKSGNGSEDDARIQCLAFFIAESQFLDDAGTHIFQKHIGRFDQFSENLFPVFRFQIDGKPAFIPVQIAKIHTAARLFFQRPCIAAKFAFGQ